MGRAWRGVATKVGQEAKRRQASTAFAALYDEQQPKNAERHGEYIKQGEDELIQREKSDQERVNDKTYVTCDQDCRDKPESTHESRDELTHNLAVTYPGRQGEVSTGSLEGSC